MADEMPPPSFSASSLFDGLDIYLSCHKIRSKGITPAAVARSSANPLASLPNGKSETAVRFHSPKISVCVPRQLLLQLSSSLVIADARWTMILFGYMPD